MLHLACCFQAMMMSFISISMPFCVTNLAKWQSLDLNILFFFLSLDYTVQALARQSSGKDVRESTKSQAVADSSFTKQESKLSQSKIKSFQGSSCEYEVQVFESISQSSTHIAASVQDVGLHHPASLSQIAESPELSKKYTEETMGQAPKILLHLQDLSVKCGDTAQFLCVLEDGSSVDVTWTHEGVKIEESGRVKQLQSGSTQFLTIHDVQLVDQGLYSCMVRNEHGEKTTSAVLSVESAHLIFSCDLLHLTLIAFCSFSAKQIETVNISEHL